MGEIVKTLDESSQGESLKIISLETDGSLKNRLEALGFLPGESVEVVIKSRFRGKAFVVSVGGTQIALRAGEASLIKVIL